MSCEELTRLLAVEAPSDADDERLARHLDACPRCVGSSLAEDPLADALVQAHLAAARFHAARRRVASALIAASFLGAIALARRTAPDLPVRATWEIRGDATGVVLTGPGQWRRAEAPPDPPAQKGDRT